MERGAIHRKTDAVEPLVHLDGILAHALANHIERDLQIAQGPASNARENGHGLVPCEFVAREVESLAGEATGVPEDANGDRSNVLDGNLRVRPCRRRRRRVDPLSKLLLCKIEVLHEGNGRKNRCWYADFGDMFFDLVLMSKYGTPVCWLAEPTEVKTRCTPAALAASAAAKPCRTSASVPPNGMVTANSEVAPSSAFVIAAVSSSNAAKSVAPAFASAWFELGSRVMARTLWPRSRRPRATAPPCLPVDPMTTTLGSGAMSWLLSSAVMLYQMSASVIARVPEASREKAWRITAEHAGPFQIVQLSAFQDPLFRINGKVPPEIRKIREVVCALPRRLLRPRNSLKFV